MREGLARTPAVAQDWAGAEQASWSRCGERVFGCEAEYARAEPLVPDTPQIPGRSFTGYVRWLLRDQKHLAAASSLRAAIRSRACRRSTSLSSTAVLSCPAVNCSPALNPIRSTSLLARRT